MTRSVCPIFPHALGRVPLRVRLSFRLRYYARKLCLLFGRCPRCLSPVNVLPSGRSLCPLCGK